MPKIGEFWEDGPGIKKLELKIKEQIFCELQSAVYNINNDKARQVDVNGVLKKPIPPSWGVTTTITLTVVENSALSPTVSVISPPPSSFFTLGLGGVASSEATRIDKYTLFYLVSDLENNSKECAPRDAVNVYGRKIEDRQGSSFFLTSELGIQDWLDTAVDIRVSRGVSAPSKEEALSYNIKFVITTSGNVTPSWSLTRVKTGDSNLLSAKRERTHELLLTFGPTEEPPIKNGLPVGPPRPGPVALTDNLASQVGSAVANSIRGIPLR